LAGKDAILARLHRRFGPPELPAPHRTHFEALVRSVVYQQLAGRAAGAIFARLVEVLGGRVHPAGVLATPADALRKAGLSAAKQETIRGLALAVSERSLDLDPARLGGLQDSEVVAELAAMRGIGVWTAQMFLIFQLRRPDVWPSGDLGVRKGYACAYAIDLPSVRQLEQAGQRFSPFRSVAAWYFWRASEAAGAKVAAAAPGGPG